MNIKNEFFVVQSKVNSFKEAQFWTLRQYEKMIGRFSIVIPFLLITSVIVSSVLLSAQLLLVSVSTTIAFALYSRFIHYTKFGWNIRKRIIYFVFQSSVDIQVSKVKDAAKNELWQLKNIVSEMMQYPDPQWRKIGDEAQNILDYKLR